MRVLGIDLGTKRIGLALSDPLGYTAQGLQTLEFQSKEKTLNALQAICREHGVTEIVIGLPINMNGSMGPKAQEILSWVEKIKAVVNLPVITWDERLTSREAGRLMVEEGLSRRKQRMESDRLAATLILQNYLESKRFRSGS